MFACVVVHGGEVLMARSILMAIGTEKRLPRVGLKQITHDLKLQIESCALEFESKIEVSSL